MDVDDPETFPSCISTLPELSTSNNGNPEISLTDINIPSNPSSTENKDPDFDLTLNISSPEPVISNSPVIKALPVNGNADVAPGTDNATEAVPINLLESEIIILPDDDTVNIGIPDISLTDINTPSNPSCTSNNCPTDP